MLQDAVVGIFTLFVLVGFVIKDVYEGHRFKHNMDTIRLTPLIILGRFAFYALYAEMGIFGILLLLGEVNFPLYHALLIHPPFEEPIELVGMTLMAAGLAVTFWSIVQIEGRELALTGPYRRVRHPIYLGCSMIAIGFFLTVLNLMALAPLLVIPAQAKMAEAEEEILAQRFGGRYADYQHRTGRMFPRIRKPR